MKRIVRLSETELNKIIKNLIKEQDEDQFMSDQNPEQMSGGLNDETAEPEEDEANFDEFLGCAKKLMDQGITIGNLVDKLLEVGEEPEEEPETPESTPGQDTNSGVAA